MISKINLNEGNNRELVNRIVVRMMDQGEEEITHTLTKLFPKAPVMRVRSMAVEFSIKRGENEFMDLFDSDDVDDDVFRLLSSADQNEDIMSLMRGRSSFEPTKFELSIICKRTPFKEFFDECRDVVCEKCIEDRTSKFITQNEFSKSPFIAKVERVEQRRLNICKGCGQMLNPRKDEINLQNERLLYKCSYCGHKGWTKAK
ncbi:MAG: hypothetical protein INQ03_09530 [Candidatus Heimdallarchaeota archaeon]|nr:hypothetical protein [Candidatus Heimdallarchaeota archaeon]